MGKPKPITQNVQLKGIILEKMDSLRDAARKQGQVKSYPNVVADAVNLFFDVAVGDQVAATRDAVKEERAVVLGICFMNILITVIQSGQNVKECEFIYQPAVDAIGCTLPGGHTLLMPTMGADPARVFFHTRDMLIKSGVAREAGADGPISTIDLNKLLGPPAMEAK